MDIGMRELRNHTTWVMNAVRSGEPVTLTVHGERVADIVPHQQRTRWLSGSRVRQELGDRAADQQLTEELEELSGQTLEVL